jgi:hypothetical protein
VDAGRHVSAARQKGEGVGLFDEIGKAVDDAAASARQAGQWQQAALAGQVAAEQPVDPDDPAFEPIEGVSLDQYARITAAMARQGLGPPEQAEAWLEGQGVRPGTWATVQSGWMHRMARHEGVRTRYGVIYARS